MQLSPFRTAVAACGRALLDQDCHLCGRPPGPNANVRLLCQDCSTALPRIASPCPRCAMPSPGGMTSPGALCGQCLREPPHFDATRAALDYSFPVDGLIQQLKYGARLPLAALFGDLMADGMRQGGTGPAADLIVPLPLHPARLRERGFNQAGEIARRLSSLTAIPLRMDGIRRTVDTPPQAGLHIKQRRANIRGAFACDTPLAGLNVAVVDDVMTTGSTLDEFAKTLKAAGAARVENWVAARTVRQPPKE